MTGGFLGGQQGPTELTQLGGNVAIPQREGGHHVSVGGLGGGPANARGRGGFDPTFLKWAGPPCRTYSLGKSLTWGTRGGGEGCQVGRLSSETIFSLQESREVTGGFLGGQQGPTELTHLGGNVAIPQRDGGHHVSVGGRGCIFRDKFDSAF